MLRRLLFVPYTVVYTAFAIAVHRVVLLGADSISARTVFRWGMRERYFAIHVLVLVLLERMLDLGSSTIGYAGALACWILMGYLLARVALVFPGVAVNHGMTLATAWRMSRSYQPVLIMITLLWPVLIHVGTLLLFYVLAVIGVSISEVYNVVQSLWECLILIFVAACVSTVYKDVVTRTSIPAVQKK